MDRFGQRTYSDTVLTKGISLQNLKKIDQTLQTLKAICNVYVYYIHFDPPLNSCSRFSLSRV